MSKAYLDGMGIKWSNVRNVIDMRSIYGGFAIASRDLNVWVMNVCNLVAIVAKGDQILRPKNQITVHNINS
ncbi:hypothetical protein JHK86_009516 [Glycine max]|nr:hypothetical protein JHK86_009516 [Glycine max]